MRTIQTVGALIAVTLLAGGCAGVGRDDGGARRYTISVQRPNQVSTGPAIRGLLTGTRGGRREIQGVLDANPGLRAALLEKGVDIRRVSALRVDPDGVVSVFVDTGE